MNLFEFYDLAKDTLIEARLHQVANFFAEQNDTTSVVSIVRNLIKVDYKNNPYFNSYKYWLKPKSPLDQIMSKEFTINPLQDDDAFMQELTFTYNNRFNNESPISKKWADAAKRVNRPQAISGKSKSIATFDDCKTLGDYKKKAEALGIIKPEYSLNDIEQAIAYNINTMTDALKTQENLKKWITNAEQTISKLKNNETQGDKND